MNLHRRHLTTAQRAVLALDLLPRLEEEAKERQREAGGGGGTGRAGGDNRTLTPETEEAKGEAAERAAEMVGLGRTTYRRSKEGLLLQKRRNGAAPSREASFE